MARQRIILLWSCRYHEQGTIRNKDIDTHADGAKQSDDITMLGVRFLGKTKLEKTYENIKAYSKSLSNISKNRETKRQNFSILNFKNLVAR